MNDKIYTAQHTIGDLDDEISRKTQSKIVVPDQDKVNAEAWKSAEDIAALNVANDKVFMSYFTHDVKWCGSDYSDGYTEKGKIFFWAKDLAGAKSKLELFKKLKNKFGISYAMALVDKGHDYYEFSPPAEVSVNDANADIQAYISKTNKPSSFQDHILALPTEQMYNEMKKSVDWAVNLLKKLKDKDIADKREAWLKTPEGQEWKQKYDREKELLQKLQSKEDARIAAKQAKENAQKMNADAIQDIINGKSSKYPDKIAPVDVQGGRKFKGKGFVIAVQWRDESYDYYGYNDGDGWEEAIVYDPVSDKIQYCNLKFCVPDFSVSNEECKKAFSEYCEKTVRKTLEWCKSKDPNKSEYELQRWAKNIIKKHHPHIDVDKFIVFDKDAEFNAQANRVASTIDWAVGLGKGQSETERIILKALAKKGIDYLKHEPTIAMKIELAYGKPPKVIKFN